MSGRHPLFNPPRGATMNESNSKPVWASKTIWINAIALIAAFAGAFGLELGLTPDVQVTIVAGVMAVINIVLRAVTHRPIQGGPKDA